MNFHCKYQLSDCFRQFPLLTYKKSLISIGFVCLTLWQPAAYFSVLAQDTQPEDALLAHLDHAISWYRRTVSLVQSIPAVGAAPARDDLKQQSTNALQSAFDYARAQAALSSSGDQLGSPVAPEGSARRSLQQAYNSATQRITNIQNQIASLTESLNKASKKKRADLLSQRDTLQNELKLNQDLQRPLQQLVDFMNNSGEIGGATGLLGHVNDLEQSVPELRQNDPKQTQGTATANNSQIFHADSAGIVGLGIEIFTLLRDQVQIDNQVKATDALLNEVSQLKAPIIKRLRALIQQSNQLGGQSEVTANQFQNNKQIFRDLEQQLTQTPKIVVPLSKESLLLESSRSNLNQWSAALKREYFSALRYLLIRFVEIALLVVVLLAVSEAWRRLTFRYVHEARLRRQMLLIRRIVMGFVLTLAVVLSFVTEIGSFATFAGFITAGIAVALQNLILSVVAYFFLIGRYGVRVGDRVTISGVTGEVVEVGLVRLYMMELSGTANNLRPSGRVVVFSNSVLFQPAAIYKQLPGMEYAWHTVTLTLASDADLTDSETRLTAVVNGVYNQYRETIKRQHQVFEQSVNLPISEPAPERSVKYTDAGLELSIRYPVEIRNAADTDEKIMKDLLDTINREPKIHFSGAPKIQTVT